ncbi:class I SAM-dependent methyltransferase [Candidatus Bathyarchaeota archaeon]|nr:class I SAM-dependent methyltransferase [Candidatus Bathyarchaeota archaeon]
MKQDIISLNRRAWDRVADEYARTCYSKITPVFKFFHKRLTPRCRVLDVGSGTGLPFSQFLVEEGFALVGIDASARMVQIARQNLPEARFRVLSMTEMDYKNEFGGVVAAYSMLLLDPPRFIQVAEKIVRALQRGGIFYLSLNEPMDACTDADESAVTEIMGETMYSRAYTEAEVREVFVPLGLRMLKLHRTHKTSPVFGEEHMMEIVFKRETTRSDNY